MDETLYLQSAIADDPTHLVKRAFSRQNDTRSTLFLEELDGSGIGDAHLRGYVERHTMFFADGNHTPVRNDEGIHIRLCRRDKPVNLLHLILEDD